MLCESIFSNTITSSCSQDPDYEFDIPEDCPEFKKLAFTCPGPKNAFAPLKRSSRQPSLYRRGDYYHTLPPPAAAAAVSTPPPPPTGECNALM